MKTTAQTKMMNMMLPRTNRQEIGIDRGPMKIPTSTRPSPSVAKSVLALETTKTTMKNLLLRRAARFARTTSKQIWRTKPSR